MTTAAAGAYKDCQAKDQTGKWFRYNTIKTMNSFCLPDVTTYVSKDDM